MEKRPRTILVVLFLCMLCTPLTLKIIGMNPSEENFENKAIMAFPRLQWRANKAGASLIDKGSNTYKSLVDFKEGFTTYYQDNFEFKNQFFYLYSGVEENVFHANPLPTKVISGESGWYFLGDSYGDIVKESAGLLSFSEKRSDRLIDSISARTNWAQSKGVTYYVAVAPNKQSIYGSKLPVVSSETPTKFMQILNARKLRNLPVIDLGANFESKKSEQLFLKTDSHWNAYGAFLGYRNFGEAVQKKFPQLVLVNFTQLQVNETARLGDLYKMLQRDAPELQSTFVFSDEEEAKPLTTKLEIPTSYRGKKNQYEKRYETPANNLKILIFRDSFFTEMEPFFKETFGNTVLIWSTRFDKGLIEKEKPDIVIQQIAERNLDYLLQ